jgi:hypothetical protein
MYVGFCLKFSWLEFIQSNDHNFNDNSEKETDSMLICVLPKYLSTKKNYYETDFFCAWTEMAKQKSQSMEFLLLKIGKVFKTKMVNFYHLSDGKYTTCVAHIQIRVNSGGIQCKKLAQNLSNEKVSSPY